MDTKKMINIISKRLNNPVVHGMYVKAMANEIAESLERQREEFKKITAENAKIRNKLNEANERIAANNAESKRMLNELEGLIAKI